MNLKLGRRSFLSFLGAAGAGLFSSSKLSAATGPTAGKPVNLDSMSSPGLPLVDGHPITPITKGFCSTGNPWAELGVTPLVNIVGTVTVMGGTVMKPEVVEAIRMGNMHFCVIDDLEVQSGKWLAKLCKAPAGYTALVTEGDASGILVQLCRHVDRGLQRAVAEHPRPARLSQDRGHHPAGTSRQLRPSDSPDGRKAGGRRDERRTDRRDQRAHGGHPLQPHPGQPGTGECRRCD